MHQLLSHLERKQFRLENTAIRIANWALVTVISGFLYDESLFWTNRGGSV